MNFSKLIFFSLLLVPLIATGAGAGLLENVLGEKGATWDENLFYTAASTEAGHPQLGLSTFFDSRYQPTFLLRMLYVDTEVDCIRIDDHNNPGETRRLCSDTMQASQFGHREGYVLENVEIGIKGKLDIGIYYRGNINLVSREKDGNPSLDYLNDAYAGWAKTFPGSVGLDLRIGIMKIPFSQANNASTADRPLIYSPTLDTLIPKRQVGAMLALHDAWDIASIKVGYYNSIKYPAEQIQDERQMMTVLRGDLDFGALANALLENKIDLTLNIGVNYAITPLAYLPKSEHRWTGIDAHLHFWLLTFECEIVWKDYYTSPKLDGSQDALRGWGWHFDATIHPWPEVLSLSFRIEEMDGDDRVEHGLSTALVADEIVPQFKQWLTFGLGLKLTDELKLGLNYTVRNQLEGYKFDNNVLIGMFQYGF